MAKVNHVKHAQKDYPEHGIVKGQEYWWTKHLRGPKLFFKQPPKPSQLTQSEFLSQAYEFEDRIASLDAKDFDTLEDLASDVESIADEIRSLGEEQQEHHDNMPEGLQESETGQLLEQRAESMEDWASELEATAGDIDPDSNDEEDKDKTLKDRIAEAIEEIQSASSPNID